MLSNTCCVEPTEPGGYVINLKQLRKLAAKAHARKITPHLRSPSLMLLVGLSAFGALIYTTFLFNPEYRGDWLPYILVISAESFIVFQTLINLWTVVAGSASPRHFQYHRTQENLFSGSSLDMMGDVISEKDLDLIHTQLYLNQRRVSVDVFVTVYGEPTEVIAKTAKAARDMLGKHKTFLLDDGASDEVKELAKHLKINYVQREGNAGAKAGNINHAVSITKGDYFVVFDADFVPSNMFIYETLPFFEDEAMALVQSPQYYDNLTNFISRGAGYMQRVFYSLVQPGKNSFNSAFCVGTNVMFRRSAILEIGGMYQQSKSEDIWTSLKLHEAGYKTVYIPEILATGDAPDTIKSFSVQQLRWATGGFEILLHHKTLFNKKLTFDQRLQYFTTTTFYLHGLMTFLLLLLPPLHIFFNLTPVNLSIGFWQWAFFYSSLYVMQIVLAFVTMGGFKFQTLVLSTVTFPVYIKALFNVLRGKDQVWQATGSIKNDSPFNYIQPQVLIFIFLLLTTGIGVWKSLYTYEFSVALVWNTINTFVFGAYICIAYGEQLRMRRQRKATKTVWTRPGMLLKYGSEKVTKDMTT